MRMLTIALAVLFSAQAHSAPPLEAYGELPEISLMTISSSGDQFAYLANTSDGNGVVVFDVNRGVIGGAKVVKGETRNIRFVGSDHIVLQASSLSAYGHYEYTNAGSYNFRTNRLVNLLRTVPRNQTGLGNLIGVHDGTNDVFMPAFVQHPMRLAVMSADLDTGDDKIFLEGGLYAIDWVVGRDGVAIAREDFSKDQKRYEIRTARRGEWESVYRIETDDPQISLIGVKYDGSSLIMHIDKSSAGYSQIRELSFEGALSEPLFAREGADVGQIVTGDNREIFGVKYTGLNPDYDFFDDRLNKLFGEIQTLMPGASIDIQSWSQGFKKILLHIEGSHRAPAYYVYDAEVRSLQKVAATRPQLDDQSTGGVLAYRYEARDGLEIPSIITTPPDIETPKKLPLVVIPHGGPESYTSIGFDWMAQYFASRGYLVLQPNFRGSGGFGKDFTEAGYGEWGGKMQDDITDGVLNLIEKGWADKDRICIIGASYGGYAALAGGAFTPDWFKCVAAIAPVSDLELMLKIERKDWGRNSFVYEYWTEYIGDLRKDSDKIKAISPVNNAAAFTAPVLLLHGDEDTIVPFVQSREMERALTKAGKDVRLTKLKGEDHWLSSSETRLQTLRELDRFVAETIGRN